jgi:hypothetical protein
VASKVNPITDKPIKPKVENRNFLNPSLIKSVFRCCVIVVALGLFYLGPNFSDEIRILLQSIAGAARLLLQSIAV